MNLKVTLNAEEARLFLAADGMRRAIQELLINLKATEDHNDDEKLAEYARVTRQGLLEWLADEKVSLALIHEYDPEDKPCL